MAERNQGLRRIEVDVNNLNDPRLRFAHRYDVQLYLVDKPNTKPTGTSVEAKPKTQP